MESLTRPSPAKLNLTLRVTGKRADGFHEIETLVTQINLCDTVSAAAHEDGCYALDCDDPKLPRDGSNLVLRAANVLNETAGTNHGARLELRKRIPAGAGLGGGSSNAATTLMLLNELWKTGLAKPDLIRLGAQIGSDVPLFCGSPLCVIRGRGEQVEDLGTPPALWAALVLPTIHCSTAAVYEAWDQAPQHWPRPSLSAVLAARGSASELMEALFNDLEWAAFHAVPELAELAQRVASAAGQAVRLTGSGAAMFRLFDDARSAARFALTVGTGLGVRVDVVALRGSEPRA
jgi:4-diphosphocytidyl-2-C-methyl-D-erythritol kinase